LLLQSEQLNAVSDKEFNGVKPTTTFKAESVDTATSLSIIFKEHFAAAFMSGTLMSLDVTPSSA
jgi:hypothetical protein